MIIQADKYPIETQSELLKLYSKQEDLKVEAKELSDEFNRLYKEVLGEIEDQYTKLHNHLEQIKKITSIYEGKPIHESHPCEGIYSIYEIKADHKRMAFWYSRSVLDYDYGVFINNNKEIEWIYDYERFKTMAKDWVVFGKSSE